MRGNLILKVVAGLVPVTLLVLAQGGSVRAFHDGGTGSCDGCHITHTAVAGGDELLLIAESPSDVCLVCHANGAGAVLGADPVAPPPERGAGNFVFLLEDNLNDAPDGATNPIPGDAAGHSIVAPGRGLAADSRNPTAPGGTFPSAQLGCTSCHDPHGNDSFRLLYGAGPVQGGIASFVNPAPDASGIGLSRTETDAEHSAYRSGMSEWCANCHGNYHDNNLSGFEHPSGENLAPEIFNQYNSYDGDDNSAGGSVATAYLAAVPFEDSTSSVSRREGPSGGSRVTCLSCHRAHATSAPHAGRWDFNVSLLADDGLVSRSYAIPDPYNSPNQGTLCSKCHAGGAPETLAPIGPGRDSGTRRPSRIRGVVRPSPR